MSKEAKEEINFAVSIATLGSIALLSSSILVGKNVNDVLNLFLYSSFTLLLSAGIRIFGSLGKRISFRLIGWSNFLLFVGIILFLLSIIGVFFKFQQVIQQ